MDVRCIILLFFCIFEKFNKMLEKYMIIIFRVHTTVYDTEDRIRIKRNEWKLIL